MAKFISFQQGVYINVSTIERVYEKIMQVGGVLGMPTGTLPPETIVRFTNGDELSVPYSLDAALQRIREAT